MPRWVSALLAVFGVIAIVALSSTELAAATGRITRGPSYMLMFVSLIALIMLVMSDQRPQI